MNKQQGEERMRGKRKPNGTQEECVGGRQCSRRAGQFKSKVKSLCTARSTQQMKEQSGNRTRTDQTTATDAIRIGRESERKRGGGVCRGRLSMVCKIGNICGKMDTQQSGQQAVEEAAQATVTLNRETCQMPRAAAAVREVEQVSGVLIHGDRHRRKSLNSTVDFVSSSVRFV